MFLTEAANRGSISTGYDIDYSISFDKNTNESLYRTPSSNGDQQKFTFSAWVKFSHVNTGVSDWSTLFSVGDFTSTGPSFRIGHHTNNSLQVSFYTNSAYTGYYRTDSLFRDLSAWYHFVVAVDTTQGTNTNRVKMYVNGELAQSTSVLSHIAQNYNTGVNTGLQHELGLFTNSGNPVNVASEYIAETHLIDGQALAPTEFGQFDSSGIWVPIEYTGTYGTNGVYLDFADASDLGDDESGNGNDYSEYNMDASDQATDTPTNNFCTLNPLIPYAVQSGTPEITEGATKHNGSGGWTGMKGTIGVNKGKWYWELRTNSGTGAELIHGVQTVTSLSASGESTATSAHNLLETAAWYVNGGHWIKDETSGRDDIAAGSITQTYGNSVIHAVALNMDDGEITYYANGSVVSGLNQVDLDGLDGETVAPFASVYNQQLLWNFGGYTTISISSAASDANGYGTFEYAPPSGYYALCTKNLAEYG